MGQTGQFPSAVPPGSQVAAERYTFVDASVGRTLTTVSLNEAWTTWTVAVGGHMNRDSYTGDELYIGAESFTTNAQGNLTAVDVRHKMPDPTYQATFYVDVVGTKA